MGANNAPRQFHTSRLRGDYRKGVDGSSQATRCDISSRHTIRNAAAEPTQDVSKREDSPSLSQEGQQGLHVGSAPHGSTPTEGSQASGSVVFGRAALKDAGTRADTGELQHLVEGALGPVSSETASIFDRPRCVCVYWVCCPSSSFVQECARSRTTCCDRARRYHRGALMQDVEEARRAARLHCADLLKVGA